MLPEYQQEYTVKNNTTVRDLRSALALLKTLPGEYVETDT